MICFLDLNGLFSTWISTAVPLHLGLLPLGWPNLAVKMPICLGYDSWLVMIFPIKTAIKTCICFELWFWPTCMLPQWKWLYISWAMSWVWVKIGYWGVDLAHITPLKAHLVGQALWKTVGASSRWSPITSAVFCNDSLQAPMNSAKKIAETKEALRARPVKMHFFLRNFQQKRIEGKTRPKGVPAHQGLSRPENKEELHWIATLSVTRPFCKGLPQNQLANWTAPCWRQDLKSLTPSAQPTRSKNSSSL